MSRCSIFVNVPIILQVKAPFPFMPDRIYSLDLCVFSQAVQNFINQTWTERYDTEISTQVLTLLWSSIVSIFTLGGLVGASVGGTLAIRFGRWIPAKKYRTYLNDVSKCAGLGSNVKCLGDVTAVFRWISNLVLFFVFSRKGTLLFNNTFALLAALFMGLSYPSSSFELLIVGRFLTGVNAGISSFQAHKVVISFVLVFNKHCRNIQKFGVSKIFYFFVRN